MPGCPQFKAIASTTSAKSPDDLAKGFAKNRDKVMVAHPFYPPHLIPFVEMVIFDNGELGMKTGKGIYDWPPEKQAEFHKKAAEPYFQFFNWDLPE